jgi:hypothetical protein
MSKVTAIYETTHRQALQARFIDQSQRLREIDLVLAVLLRRERGRIAPTAYIGGCGVARGFGS